MAGKPKEELSEKHWRALKLIEEGMSRKQVADKIGWSYDYFGDLASGNISKAGYTADLFKKELQKIEEKQDEEAQCLLRENTVSAQNLIKRCLKSYESKKTLSADDKALIATLTNALSKSKPSVTVKDLSYSYTQGLSVEDLLHEFTRLKNIAEGSFNRRPVQITEPDGPGSLPKGS